jgi:lipopolysaccharide/colanic/teichoic acid biosynthesis glycosyltransferase
MDSFYRKYGKRMFDVVFTTVFFIVLSPLLIILTLAVRIVMGSPVLFRQERPGLYGRPFTLLKFRTMTRGSDVHGRPLPDAQRLTSFGQRLRRTSLDELPEMWNVLRGDMSLVGPRPLLMQYLERYNAQQMRRHDVRPGITGWAQIHGRNAITWPHRFTLDVWYVDHMSFAIDLKIIALTCWKVIKREGISEHGQATMTEFTGQE